LVGAVGDTAPETAALATFAAVREYVNVVAVGADKTV
jgi:hypothetical protein